MDTELHSSEKEKDQEIANLKALVEQLQQQLQLEKIEKDKLSTKPEVITAQIQVTKSTPMDKSEGNTKPTKKSEKVKTLPYMGKSRVNPIIPSKKSVSLCKHRGGDEIVV